ncbi:MAG: hypothetical protein FGM15_12625 [Chthoniobacterales bacterium]|nr:hypothetical protein [Chthoniobacterales bacterium]
MKIHLNRQGQSLGQFTALEVRSGFRDGKFFATDLAWQDGMPMWRPLGEVIDTIAPGESVDSPPALPETAEPAWERRGEVGAVPALFETVRAVLLEPAATFARLKLGGGFAGPLVFFIILQMVGIVATEAYNWTLRVLGLPGMVLSQENAAALTAQMGTSFGSLLWIVVAPVFLVFAAFVGTAITHVCLMLVGGARRPFESTFRVYTYVSGSIALFNLVPCCGWFVGFIWGLVAEIIGLSEVHHISRGRAAVAVLLPIFLCCGLVAAMVLAGWLAYGPAFLETLKNQS